MSVSEIKPKKETFENRAEAYWKMLNEFKPGIYYIFTHQCLESSDNVLTDNLDIRINDYKFWTSEGTKKKLKEKNYVIINCIPLRKEFQKALNESK